MFSSWGIPLCMKIKLTHIMMQGRYISSVAQKQHKQDHFLSFAFAFTKVHLDEVAEKVLVSCNHVTCSWTLENFSDFLKCVPFVWDEITFSNYPKTSLSTSSVLYSGAPFHHISGINGCLPILVLPFIPNIYIPLF